MFRILTLVAIVLLPLQVHAKDKKPRKHELRKEQKEHTELGKRTGIYWRSVRWKDFSAASIFVENPNDQLMFQQWLDEQSQNHKITDAKVLRIEVSPEKRKPKDGRIRSARVTVAIEGFTLPEQILKKQTLQQHWYQTSAGWFLDWSAPPPSKP